MTERNIGPRWLHNAIFYEIYPQSFRDTNGDGIGDLNGIIEKLDYIKDLGCNALWLNPCFQSPFLDAGYDISDYYQVAPRYGTNEDMKRLFDEAHRRGMHVLLDLVPGHTSVEHKWFRESCKADPNPYTDRYIWTQGWFEVPEGYNALCGVSEREGCCVVNFFSHQPALNYGYYQPDKPWQQGMEDPGPTATLEAMKDVMRFWLSMGCDGFRVDMAGSLVKKDVEGKGTVALWRKVRAFLQAEFPDAAMVSEWGEPDKSLQGGFHMDFLLHFGPSHYNDLFRCEHPFFGGDGDASAFVAKYADSYEKSERKGLICIPSGNHDMDRLARTIQGVRQKIAFAFLLSMPGAPFIYYGDEIGMRYVEGLHSVEGGYRRTGSRTPMQWDRSANAGFSAASPEKLYLPLDAAADRPTAQDQMGDGASLRSEIQRLIALRQAHPALGNLAEIDFLPIKENAYPLAYVRTAPQEKLLVILNPSDQAVSLSWEGPLDQAVYTLGDAVQKTENGLNVAPRSAGFYTIA